MSINTAFKYLTIAQLLAPTIKVSSAAQFNVRVIIVVCNQTFRRILYPVENKHLEIQANTMLPHATKNHLRSPPPTYFYGNLFSGLLSLQ